MSEEVLEDIIMVKRHGYDIDINYYCINWYGGIGGDVRDIISFNYDGGVNNALV